MTHGSLEPTALTLYMKAVFNTYCAHHDFQGLIFSDLAIILLYTEQTEEIR